MRITYIHQYFNTLETGGGTRSFEFARRLVRSGHTVNMITADRTSSYWQWRRTMNDGIHVHRIGVRYSNHMTYPQRMLAFSRFLIASALRARSLQSDVVFASSTPLTVGLSGLFASKLRRVSLVFEVRDLWPELPIAVGAIRNPILIWSTRQLETLIYRNSAHVIALSPGMKEGVVSTGYPETQVTVIPNACDFEVFEVDDCSIEEFRQRHDWLRHRPLVLYAGTLGLINGVDFLARVAAETHRIDPDVRFLVVGSGRQETNVRSEAARLGVLNRNFFMMPACSKRELAVILGAAQIATSLFIDLEEMWANSANKFFDALASGTPIAINYGGWQADLIERRCAGIVLDPHDVPGSSNRLVSRVRDCEWVESAGQNAHKLGEERFSRDDLAGKFEAILRAAREIDREERKRHS